MGKRLLTREEVAVIREKMLPRINKEYRDVVALFNLLAERLAVLDGDDLYLPEDEQKRLLKRVSVNLAELVEAAVELRRYVGGVKRRLNVDD